jgi:hypothetical protein
MDVYSHSDDFFDEKWRQITPRCIKTHKLDENSVSWTNSSNIDLSKEEQFQVQRISFLLFKWK